MENPVGQRQNGEGGATENIGLYDGCEHSVNAANPRARVVQHGTKEEKKRVFSKTAKFFVGK